MRVKKIDIIHRFIPLAWDIFFVIFMAFQINVVGMNLIVAEKYQFLAYIHLGISIILLVSETVIAKRVISRWRIRFLILLLVLALSLPPLLKDWDLFYTFVVLMSAVDLLLILVRMLRDSVFSEERTLNQKLPVNQFTDRRKLVSRVVTIVSFLVLFVISFVVFYYNDVSLEAILILFFVGVIIAAIGQIISLSISLKPMRKFEKEFAKDLNFTKLKNSVLALYEDRLHDETINLMNITLWKYSSFVTFDEAAKYEELVFKPNYDGNLNSYYEAFFWYLLNKKDYNLILVSEKEFKKAVKPKKLFKAYLSLIKGEKNKYKFKKKLNKLEEVKKELYLELEKNIIEK